MKNNKNIILFLACIIGLLFVQCDDDENGNVIEQQSCTDGVQNGDEVGIDCGGSNCDPCTSLVDFSGDFIQEDHLGRPAINMFFGGEGPVQNNFNVSITSERTDFQPFFQGTLEDYYETYEATYETNILGLDLVAFTTFVAKTDALQVAPDAPTTYFDGTNILTGRKLSDDAVDITLTFMFGGETGTLLDGTNDTPQLTSDGVDAGDREFTIPFPYLEAPNQL